MNTTLIIVFSLAAVGYSQQNTPTPTHNEFILTAFNAPPPADAPSPVEPKPDPVKDKNAPATVDPKAEPDKDKNNPTTVKPLTADEQKKLLSARLDGGMGHSFRQFANMFLVTSRINLGTGIGLMTSDKEIAALPLQSPFPAAYKPTLQEFLDAIALQTFSVWKYDPSNKYVKSDVDQAAPLEGLAIFEFTKRTEKREKPYTVTLAEKWKTLDKGNWVMHVPPTFPIGMDIYEMGTYSTEEKIAEQDFANKIRSAVALEWAQRVNEKAKQEDLKSVKVGTLDALYYESMIPSQLNKDIKWRQWVIVADKKCYFIVSTILPEFEAEIFPDVQKMVASFRIEKK